MTGKKRLGEMLLEAGIIDETQLHAALGHQRKWGGKLGQALLDLKLATEPQVVSALARKFGYETVQLGPLVRTPALEAALRLVPRELALRQTLIPIASDTSSVTVAMGDPSNIAVVDELSFRTGKRVRIVLGGDREIAAAVRRLYFAEEDAPRVAAIPLDEPSGDGPMELETVRDPFAAMPDHIREGYFNRPAHTLAGEGGPSVHAPSAPDAAAPPPAPASPARAPPPLPQTRPAPARPPAPPPVAAGPQGELAAPRAEPPPLSAPPPPISAPPPPIEPRVDALPSFTPPPVLSRAQSFPAPPPPAMTELLGEPILATELAPEPELEGRNEGPQPDRPLTHRQAALRDALERAARGEDSPLFRPAQLAAALARLLLERGLITEVQLLELLSKKP